MLGAIARAPLRINHDAAMYLLAGDLLLEGARPYVDFVDPNPPLVIYLSAVPAAIARGLGLPPIPTFLVGVWILSVASILATRRVLLRSLPARQRSHAEAFAIAMAFGAAYLLWQLDLGQREHLFVAAFLPFLALRDRRWAGGRISSGAALSAGVLAGLGACLKPQFLAIAAAPELYWMLKGRRLRPLLAPEMLAVVAGTATYALHFLLLPPEVREAFFGRWLPLLVEGYRAYDRPFEPGSPGLWAGPAAVAMLLVWRPHPPCPARRFAAALAAAGATASLAFVSYGKYYPYQAIPALACGFGALVIGAAELISRAALRLPSALWLWSRRLALLAIALVALQTAAVVANSPLERGRQKLLMRSPLARAIHDHSGPGDRVLVLSTAVRPAHPLLLQLDRRPGSRPLWLFALPMLYHGVRAPEGAAFPYRVGDRAAPDEELRLRSELDRAIAQGPALILVGDHPFWCQGCPPGFELSEYLERTGLLERIRADYGRVDTIDGIIVYRPRRAG